MARSYWGLRNESRLVNWVGSLRSIERGGQVFFNRSGLARVYWLEWAAEDSGSSKDDRAWDAGGVCTSCSVRARGGER